MGREEDLAKQHHGRFAVLEGERTQFETHWQDVSDYVAGRRDFTRQRQPGGEARHTFIFDTTAMHRGGLLAAGLHGLQSDPLMPFFSLTTSNPDLMADVDVRGWLDFSSKHLLNLYRQPARGFNRAYQETYTDLVWFANAGCFQEDDAGPRFVTRALRGLYWSANRFAQIDTIYEKFPLSARNAAKEYGDRAGKATKAAMDARNPQPDKEVWFLRVVHPTDDPDPRSLLASRRMAFVGLTFPFEEKTLAREEGFEEMPYHTPRWDCNAGEAYSFGPGMYSAPDAMMLNEMQKTVLVAGQKATDPPALVPDKSFLKTPVRLYPGGQMIARESAFNQKQSPIQLFPVDARGVGIGLDLIRAKQGDVSQHFLPELLQLLQREGLTPPSATEVVHQATAMAKVAAPILGNQRAELIGPSIRRSFAIELRRGSLPPVPMLLQGEKLEIQYESPAARAQKTGEVDAIASTLRMAGEWAQIEPEVLHNINSDEAIRAIAQFEGIPASVVRSMSDVLERREAEGRAAQAQQQLAMLQQGAAAAKDIESAAAMGA